jgi:hypothetical protein
VHRLRLAAAAGRDLDRVGEPQRAFLHLDHDAVDAAAQAISEGIATHSPAAVATSASAMPPESIRGSPAPPALMALKALMMPVTVPSSPSSGDTPAIVPSVFRKRSSS